VDGRLLLALAGISRELLERHELAASSRARATWEHARQFVDEHAHLDISRDAVAAAVGLHPNYLSHLFRAEGQESFLSFLTRRRMERAAELVGTTRHGLAEVARACGYGSTGAFIRAFRRFHHATPGSYRRGR
jgi:two-component system response regulator YesN